MFSVDDILQFFFGGNNEVLALILMTFLCVGPLILIWKSTRVIDRQYNQYINASPGTQGGVENLSSNNASPEVLQNQSFQTATFTFAATVGMDASERNSTPEPASPGDEATSSAANLGESVEPAEEPTSPVDENNEGVEPTTSQNNEENDEGSETPTLLPGHFHIRLKYLDDTARIVQAKPTDTIGDFRRKNFPAEQANRYRLIYRGQVLRNNNQTVQQCGLAAVENPGPGEMPVVHCFLSMEPDHPNLPNSSSSQLQQAVEELNIGHFFLPLLGMIISFLWYLCIYHTTLFTIPSMFGVLGLSCFYIVLLVNRFV